jgi:hypothetical protein
MRTGNAHTKFRETLRQTWPAGVYRWGGDKDQAERNSTEQTSMDAIGSKFNLRVKDNPVTWISCMGSLQTLKEI